MQFLKRLEKKAKKNPKTIVFPESTDLRTLKAVSQIQKKGIAVPILLGSKEKTLQFAKKNKISLGKITIVDLSKENCLQRYAKKYQSIRKKENISLKKAEALLKDPMYFGAMMVRDRKADGLIGGAVSTTKETVIPALKLLKKRKSDYVSSFSIVLWKKKVLFFADCAVNIDPSAKELAQIAIDTAKNAKIFGIKPKIAMLSFSTQESAHHPMQDKVAKATKMVKKKLPSVLVDGEMQFDAAFVPWIAKHKYQRSKTKGEANVFIFPNLDSGNIAYKIAERMAGATVIGPLLQNLIRPVNDLSRGCSVQDIVNLTVLTVDEVQRKK